ncbi:MAG: response regulator [Kofleriaceae bacterium]|nr:response regulator [Kofleriaceae bacterium]
MARVLIIDDDIDSAEILAEIMRMEGHEVHIGYNGQDGVRLATEHTPQLALLDIEMPLLDGPGVAYEMLLHNMGLEQVPVVFLSGSPALNQIASKVGTPYFLSKPYSYQQILALVSRALAERAAPTWALDKREA